MNDEAWADFREELLSDPKTRAEWERTAPARAIAEILISLRSKLGLSQRQFADVVGMKQPAIARIESCDSSPTWETVYRMVASVGAELELRYPRFPRARSRDGALEVESSGFLFRTVPERPGFLDVFEAASGRRDGAAVVFAGTPIRSLEPTRNGVIAETGRHRARVSKNPKGYWTVADVTRLE